MVAILSSPSMESERFTQRDARWTANSNRLHTLSATCIQGEIAACNDWLFARRTRGQLAIQNQKRGSIFSGHAQSIHHGLGGIFLFDLLVQEPLQVHLSRVVALSGRELIDAVDLLGNFPFVFERLLGDRKRSAEAARRRFDDLQFHARSAIEEIVEEP